MKFLQYQRLLRVIGGVALVSLAPLVLPSAHAQAQALDAPSDLEESSFPVVITPTRLRQSLADVPASVTVITAQTMRDYGITRVQDALRLVPGMVVAESRGGEYQINYHGTNSSSPRRLNVLIDGVSVYRPAFSRVDWSLLPVALEDIDRIEVIRGPDSAAYGPNSMAAVVNILTKHPMDVERGLVSASGGGHGQGELLLRAATQLGATSLRVTGQTQRQSGYDHSTMADTGRDSIRVKRLNVRAQSALADGATLDMQAALVESRWQVGVFDADGKGVADRSTQDQQFSARWTRPLSSDHEVQVEVFYAADSSRLNWRTCGPKVTLLPALGQLFLSNRAYVEAMYAGQLFPTGGTAQDNALANDVRQAVFSEGLSAFGLTCGRVNEDGDESRTQLELQDTYVLNDQWRFVSGLGIRYQRADSQTYFNGSVGNTVRWAFGHAEFRPMAALSTNLGGYVESNSLSGSTFSPRLAVNWHLGEDQTVRAVMSRGTRSPDLFEQRAHWGYTFTDLSPAAWGSTTGHLFSTAIGKSNLSSERIWSRELGYLLTSRSLGLTVDARVFDDHVSDLISGYLTLVDFRPRNSGYVHLTGAEVQTRWDLSPQWSALMTYAYLLNRDRSGPEEAAQYERHSGSLGLTHAFGEGWRASLLQYNTSGSGVNEWAQSRTDLSLSKALNLGAQRALLQVTWTHQQPESRTYHPIVGYVSATYDQASTVLASLRVSY
jgi:iron complex outermembrane receptor protein